MFERDIFKVNAGVADGLESIKSLKSLSVKLQKYEYTAKLRDIEKHLEFAEKALLSLGYPISVELKPDGELFTRQLFYYAQLNSWILPEKFTDFFKARKVKLNEDAEFMDDNILHLIDLNRKLTAEENQITSYLNFFKYPNTLKKYSKSLNEINAAEIVIKCFTHTDKYNYNQDNLASGTPFYLFKLSLNDLLNSKTRNYESNKPVIQDDAFLRTLPLQFLDENMCFLFFSLANEGLLAWEDFLNIERVEIELTIKHQFSASN